MSEDSNGTFDDDLPQVPEQPRRQIGRRKVEQVPPGPVGPEAGTDLTTKASSDADSFHVEVDPREDKVAELQVSALFVVGILATLGFLVSFFTIGIHTDLGRNSNFALGGTLAVSLIAIGAGMIVWAKKLIPHERTVQERHAFHSAPEEEKEAEDTLLDGVDVLGLGKRKILRRTLVGALALFPLPLVVMLRDLGPLPRGSLLPSGSATLWKKGSRLVDIDTRIPVKLGDLSIGGIQTVMPEGFSTPDETALAPTMLIRFAPGEIESQKELNWGVDGHVAYSKICTHAGCPISLYEQQTHNLLCPCHQSTFDMSRDAKVIFGPAARPLPQLKIEVDSEGYLIAAGPYSQPVGPSFWERR